LHTSRTFVAWGYTHIQDSIIVAAWGYAHIQARTSSIDHFIAVTAVGSSGTIHCRPGLSAHPDLAWGYRHIQTCAGYRHCTTLTADHPSEASTVPTPIVVVVFTIVGSAPPLTI